MKHLMVLCLIATAATATAATAATAASAQSRPPDQVIREDGALVLTDGASFYRFNRDSSFESGPIALYGRTITGRWRARDSQFIVEGLWGWNRASLPDDRRRMTMDIRGIDGPGTMQAVGRDSLRVHSAYYHIEAMIPLPPLGGRGGGRAGAGRNFMIDVPTNNMPGVNRVVWRAISDRCTLEIDYRDTFSASAPPQTQVWLLRNDGTVIAPTRAAVVSGVGFPGAGPPKVAYLYERAVEGEADAVLVKLGDEYLFKSLRP
jgi:hypothetical protein